MCWRGESAGSGLRTLAAAQGLPLTLSVTWTNYSLLWRFSFSIFYLGGVLTLWFPYSPLFYFLNLGQHFFPRKFYMDPQCKKQNYLAEVGTASQSPIHSACPAQTLPEMPWTLEEPLGTMEPHLKTLGSDLKGPASLRVRGSIPSAEEKPLVKSQLLLREPKAIRRVPLALSREPDSTLGWGHKLS